MFLVRWEVVGVCWEDWRGNCGFEVELDEGSDSVMRFAVRGHVTGFRLSPLMRIYFRSTLILGMDCGLEYALVCPIVFTGILHIWR